MFNKIADFHSKFGDWSEILPKSAADRPATPEQLQKVKTIADSIMTPEGWTKTEKPREKWGRGPNVPDPQGVAVHLESPKAKIKIEIIPITHGHTEYIFKDDVGWEGFTSWEENDGKWYTNWRRGVDISSFYGDLQSEYSEKDRDINGQIQEQLAYIAQRQEK